MITTARCYGMPKCLKKDYEALVLKKLKNLAEEEPELYNCIWNCDCCEDETSVKYTLDGTLRSEYSFAKEFITDLVEGKIK